MQKVDIKKLAGVSMLSLGLVVGVAGFAGATSGTIDTTGANSDNKITHESKLDVDVDNDTDVDLSNRNHQHASSGDVKVKYNTTGGDAESGSATNSNSVDAEVEVDNSGALSGVEGLVSGNSNGSSNTASIENTGYRSDNEVKYESRTNIDVDNDTDVNIRNSSEQSARSGDAEVRYNTTGGSATSGNVSNTNSSSFSVRVSN